MFVPPEHFASKHKGRSGAGSACSPAPDLASTIVLSQAITRIAYEWLCPAARKLPEQQSVKDHRPDDQYRNRFEMIPIDGGVGKAIGQ